VSGAARRARAGLAAALAALLPAAAGAQAASPPPGPLTAAVRGYRVANERRILGELTALLALPNLASDRVGIRRNAALVSEMLARRGLAPRLLEAPGDSTAPVVYGEYRVPGATRTLVFYAHYDGQPADPAQWTGDPWKPVFRTAALDAGGEVVALPPGDGPVDPSWRLYARSASDDKAGVVAILTAFDALRAAGRAPAANLKFFFEGEEEAGSPNLAAILARHRALLGADAWIICDGPIHQSGRKQVVFGVRGDVNADLTVYGPTRPLHSGHYGNWAPNPGMELARLLATMTDTTGRVRVAGWYDDVAPLGGAEREAIAAAPRPDSALRAALGLARTDGRGRALAELITEPSLNVNGVRSGDVGAQSRNVIPTSAVAALDLRLVLGNDPERQVAKLRAHVAAQGYHVLDRAPTAAERARHPRIATLVRRPGGYAAERTPMTTPAARAVLAAVQSTVREPVVAVPTLGGSLPLVVFRESLGATTITVPIANPDNNQHAENENLRVGALWDGIESLAAVMGTPAPR
jgi:acetylornithine deacetylase/succinyl-diaminopimelate desuccinylase-like protein